MNKVIIIGGGGYHNSLGLARVFGINNIKPYAILLKSQSYSKWDNPCILSKYWEKYWLVDDENQALKLLIEMFSNESEKPVLVPSSDGAALAIDSNYDKLQEMFILPGISEQGAITRLMDKHTQAQWAKNLGIDVANTEILELHDNDACKCSLRFPVILKPVISAEGHKYDIKKCESEKELNGVLSVFRSNGYRRILAQEFVNKDYEIELFGSILKNSNRHPYLLSEHYREWPSVGGTVCYHRFITNKELKRQAEILLDRIKASGYVGNIDIELFMVKGRLMLNEVNFRNSGDIYACFANKVYYPYFSYLDMINKDVSSLNFEYDDSSTAMDEILDVRHLVYGKLGLREWIRDWIRCKDFSLAFKDDMKPALARYFSVFFKIFSRAKEERSKIS